MADPAEDGGEETLPSSDANLSRIFQEASGVTNEEPAVEESAPVTETKPAAEPNAEILAELNKLKERQLVLETENNILKMGISKPQTAPAPIPAPEPDVTDGIDMEALNAGLRTDPGKTIVNLVKSVTAQVREQVKAEAIEATTAHVAGMSSQERAFNQDRTAFQAEYGELIANDADFRSRAEQVYHRMTQGDDAIVIDPSQGTRWKPNAMYSAASIAFAQLVRENPSKYAGSKAEAPAPTNVVTLNERRKPPVNPMVGTTGGTGGGGGSGVNTLNYSAEELGTIRRTASQFGMTLENYLKRVNDLRKKDPSFGGF